MNNELRKSLEMRQENLIFLLKNKKDQLELEKQHQLYGAIKEIDYILRMLSVSEEEEVEEMKGFEQQQMQQPQPQPLRQQPPTIKQPAEKKSFKVPIKIKFQKA